MASVLGRSLPEFVRTPDVLPHFSAIVGGSDGAIWVRLDAFGQGPFHPTPNVPVRWLVIPPDAESAYTTLLPAGLTLVGSPAEGEIVGLQQAGDHLQLIQLVQEKQRGPLSGGAARVSTH